MAEYNNACTKSWYALSASVSYIVNYLLESFCFLKISFNLLCLADAKCSWIMSSWCQMLLDPVPRFLLGVNINFHGTKCAYKSNFYFTTVNIITIDTFICSGPLFSCFQIFRKLFRPVRLIFPFSWHDKIKTWLYNYINKIINQTLFLIRIRGIIGFNPIAIWPIRLVVIGYYQVKPEDCQPYLSYL